MDALEEGLDLAALEVFFKMSVRIEKVADDDIEGSEVSHQIRIENRLSGEKWSESSVFNGSGSIDEATCFSESNELLVAENFQMGLWKGLAEEPNDRKGQNKVPECPSTDDEDSSHRVLISENRGDEESRAISDP